MRKMTNTLRRRVYRKIRYTVTMSEKVSALKQ
jgi:hypothetical protein